MPLGPEQNSGGQAGKTWAHPPPQEGLRRVAVCMANPPLPLPLLPLHFLAAPFPVSLHTHSWPVPIPSSVSGLLVVHINYTFLSVCSVIFEWGSSLIGGRDKERKGIAFCRYILSIFFLLKNLVTLPLSQFYFLDHQLKLRGFFSNPNPNVTSSV